jgi:C1A family cysteine protease
MPPVYDQHGIGACVANALAACIQFVRSKNSETLNFVPSRLFIYYLGRVAENSVATDGGLSIADAINVVLNKGVLPETDWPYDGTPPDDKNKFLQTSRAIAPPRQATLNEAALHKTTAAFKLPPQPNLNQLKQCLAAGYPFLFGFTIYKSFFDNNQTPALALPHVPLPPAIDEPIGGHAVVAVGYIDDQSVAGGGSFICRNSWGVTDIASRQVQDGGHFYMPYAYTQDTDLSSDFWTVRASN